MKRNWCGVSYWPFFEKQPHAQGFTGATEIKTHELLISKCDVLVPAALQNVITVENASKIQAKLIVEGANGPTTPETDPILKEKNIICVPDILANAGGVTVSYFGGYKTRPAITGPKRKWTPGMIKMLIAFEEVWHNASKYKTSMRIGAYITAYKTWTRC